MQIMFYTISFLLLKVKTQCPLTNVTLGDVITATINESFQTGAQLLGNMQLFGKHSPESSIKINTIWMRK